MTLFKHICWPLFVLTSFTLCAAYTPPSQVSFEGHKLSQTGSGIRTAIFGVKVYHITHYLDVNTPSDLKRASDIERLDYARQFTMHFLRSVGGKRLKNGFYESLRENNPSYDKELLPISPRKRKRPNSLTPLQTDVLAFLDVVGIDVDDGSEITLRYIPQKGLFASTSQNSTYKRIGDRQLAELVWRIWLGSHPPKPGKELKKALLKSL